MRTIEDKQCEFIETYNALRDPLMQYEFLLRLAGDTAIPAPEERNEASRIPNCQTESWFVMRAEQGKLLLKADSDSLLIRGVLGIYVYLLGGQPLEEIVRTQISFMEKTEIRRQLSLDRFSVMSQLSGEVRRFCRECLEERQS